METFAGLNVHSFNPFETFIEILSLCLGQKCLLFSIIKERCLCSQKKFCGTLENCENFESLTSESFHVYSMFKSSMI